MTSKVMTKFEQKAIDDLAVTMFDLDVAQEDLAEQLESMARNLGCSVGQLVAGYLRSSLQVFSETPRQCIGEFGLMGFDLVSARERLRKHAAEARYTKHAVSI